jgi:hypothetical protein
MDALEVDKRMLGLNTGTKEHKDFLFKTHGILNPSASK